MNTQAENGSLPTAPPQDGDAVAFVRQGFQLAGQQRLDEAVASLDRAIALEPAFAEAWIGRGIVLFYLGRLDEAVASYDRVLALRPDAEAFRSRGLALYTLGRFGEAVASYDDALALKPDAEAFNIRGLALHKLGRFDAAVASYGQALALKPDYAEVFNSRAAALAKLGRFESALESIDQAIALRAGSAEVCLIVGVDLYNLGRLDDALACYNRALALKPDYADAHFHRALALLSAGDFARGFEDYRWRFRIEDERRRPSRPEGIACPDWEGEPLAGKRLVIFVEQGFGDALQFVRYVPMAAARGAQVTLFAPSALLTLLRASLPGVEVTDTLPKAAVFDFQAPMLCLPRLFGTTLDTVPAQTPYLLADRTAAAAWAQRLAALPDLTRPDRARPDLKIGLVWAGSSRLPDIDARRSLKLAQLAPLAAIPGIRFVSLQIGEPAAEAKTPPAGLDLVDWTSEIRDYADTAALVAGLDLVITVDTSVAHLAGGLGKPVWILSRYDGCWRWLMRREDSPWYPSARLFHQPAPGDWEPVIAQVAVALQAFSSNRQAAEPNEPATASPPQGHDAVALVRRGLQLSYQQRFDEAVASFDDAIALRPDFAEAWSSRGIALFSLGRLDDAVTSYDGALALQPDAEIFSIRGLALYLLERLDEAVASYDRALALQPDYAEAHVNRAQALLRAGDLKRGFEAYRWRFQIDERPARLEWLTCPDWKGEPIDGKRLMIFHEQGFGDSLQFVRFVPMAAARGAHVTLFVPPALRELLRASLPGIEVVDSLAMNTVFDYQAPMLSLPAIFGTTLDTIPARMPYLAVDRAAAAGWARRLAALPGRKVGLVWAGGRDRSYDERRSLTLAQYARLAAVPDTRFVSLQVGEAAEQARTPPAGLELIDWTSEIRDYADTAALIAGLDLVITVCTSVAHLAGALGKPVWILLHQGSCWRWLLNRDDSPWYPSARLFRQSTMGRWEPVVADVAAALQASSAPKNVMQSNQTNTRLSDAVALVRQGIQLAGQQHPQEAVASFDSALAINPDFAEAWIVRGIVLFDLGRFEEAVASYDRVLALQPDAEAFNCRGAALYNLGRLDEAVASYDRALALKPDAEAFDTRGAALYKLARYDEAVASYDQALALKPDAEIFTRRGAALYDLGRFDEAIASYDHALALRPEYAEALNSRGAALENAGRHHDALASYDRALALKPDHAKTHWNRSLVLLRLGDLKRGFEAYRWRFQANEAPPSPFACPDWHGEPIAGKQLVIFHEQGFGDTLQFVRYVPMAAALGAQITLFVPPALLELLRASLPGIQVIARVPEAAVFDFQAPMLSLPAIFGTTLETIPAPVPYLAAGQAAAASWARRLAALPGPARRELKVGLVWAGGKKVPTVDARRSFGLAQLAPLATVPGIQFISLQLGEPAEEARTPPAGLRLTDWTSEIRDYADTAALVAGLDLVITVDTSVAHLAGGLGKPVWILSRYDGCWRWLLNRQDSPWYPTARLFHQPAMGAWQPVIADVAAALQALSARQG